MAMMTEGLTSLAASPGSLSMVNPGSWSWVPRVCPDATETRQTEPGHVHHTALIPCTLLHLSPGSLWGGTPSPHPVPMLVLLRTGGAVSGCFPTPMWCPDGPCGSQWEPQAALARGTGSTHSPSLSLSSAKNWLLTSSELAGKVQGSARAKPGTALPGPLHRAGAPGLGAGGVGRSHELCPPCCEHCDHCP